MICRSHAGYREPGGLVETHNSLASARIVALHWKHCRRGLGIFGAWTSAPNRCGLFSDSIVVVGFIGLGLFAYKHVRCPVSSGGSF